MASKSEAIIFLLIVLVLISLNCEGARPKKPKTTTTPIVQEILTTTTTPTPQVREPDTDRMIYHNGRTNDLCECGVFKFPKKSIESPLYYQTAMQNFHCDEQACKEMCMTLPAFNPNRGVEILCANLNSAVGLKPAVHYKNCNDNWLFAGSTLPLGSKPICCDGGKLVPCK